MAKGMSGMMKQVQKMQKKMVELQGELEQERVEGTAGGGMVTVVANGRQDILEIKIQPDVVNPDDVEMLEDLILAAIHQAQQRAQEMMDKEMGQITGGVQIPGLTL
ncbi:MAG TPA: YbaB/EbfC family nucleoid-associated protein [candidate division Zixibacteria bacterium]|jgi:DNA-binding YbaB/EbfC family protein|nr:YbaB/EbfC family nucleoid-associated protein [Candidatus Latescibacterota bacterium]HIG47342.1 YbaB/EbfC family nucleoid-associated protein [candidate division Zixibacteria bacterium]